MPAQDRAWVRRWFAMVIVVIMAPPLILLTPLGRGPDTPRLAAVLTLVGALVAALVSLAGQVVTRQSDRRLEREHKAEQGRLGLDAAMRAGTLLSPNDSRPADPAAVASGLLALTKLDHAELAVALLVDLWDVRVSKVSPARVRQCRLGSSASRRAERQSNVSTETAILVIDHALRSGRANAQLVAAELLCRNAARLDSVQSLHWPSRLDGNWDPRFGPKTKFLLIDALVSMTLARKADQNSLRALAVRLYGIWESEEADEHVRGCVGLLIDAVLPKLYDLRYKDFLQGSRRIMLDALSVAARSAKPNPDQFLAQISGERASRLREWAGGCSSIRLEAGRLGDASVGAAKP